jgi:hypothetical protein
MSEPERNDEMRAAVREILQELVPAAPGGHSNGNGHSDGNGHHNGERPSSVDEGTVVPQVPAPPVPAVMRPSTWNQPPAPGEVIGNAAPASASAPLRPAAASPRRESLRAAFSDADFRPSAPSGPAPRGPSAPPQAGDPAPAVSPTSAPAHPSDVRVEAATIDTDEDLEQFIRRLMSRLENPRERVAIRTGRLRFSLHRSATTATAGGAGSSVPARRVERGAVTERMIRAAAADGTRLVLAPGAVLTPLAREQARARGVEIERERRC